MFKAKAGDGGMGGDTVIAGGVKVEGDFVSEGNVVIEGEVVGSLRTAQDLQVGDRARISADVTATNARIAGEVRGNVAVKEKLELTASSRIIGDVHAKVLIVEAGAQMNGRVHMGAEATVPVEKPAEARVGGLSSLVGGRGAKAEKTASA